MSANTSPENEGRLTPVLNGCDDVWLIEQGEVDIFAVELKNATVRGARMPICRLRAGQLVCGLGDIAADAGLGLLALVLPQTRLSRLATGKQERAEFFSNTRQAELAAWVDDWLIELSAALPQTAAGDAAFQPGAGTPSDEGVVWLTALDDQNAWLPVVLWMPRPQLRSRTTVLALNVEAWMLSTADDDLRCQTSASLIAAGQLEYGLHAFHQALLEHLRQLRAKQQQALQRRLQHKHSLEELSFDASLSDLAAVMEQDRKGIALEEWSGVPLVDACLLVMQAGGIQIALRPGEKITTLNQNIETLAYRAHAAMRQVRLSGERWWDDDAGPLLAFRNDGTPVALLPQQGRGYWLVDPVQKNQTPLTEQLAAELADNAVMFFRSFPDRALGFMDLLRFGTEGGGTDLKRVLSTGLLAGLLGVALPFAISVLIDNVIPNGRMSELWQLVLLLLSTALGIGAFEFTRAIAMLRLIEGRFGNNAQASVMQRLLYLPAAFFRRYLAGDLAYRSMGLEFILQQFNGSAQAALIGWVFSLSSLAVLLLFNWRLALLAALLIAAIVALTFRLNRKRLELERQQYLLHGELASQLFQIMGGIAKLHGSGAEKRAFTLWAKNFAKQKQLNFKARRLGNVITVFESAYTVVASALLFGVVAFAMPALSTGEFVFFNTAFSQLFTATVAMFNALVFMLPAVPLYERLKPILRELPEISDAHNDPGSLSGDIEIGRVTFRYTPDGPIILNDVSIHIKAGEFVAFVGPSGSGKSTLYRLLLGFEQPEVGAVYYDGQDLSGLNIGAVRRQIGVVLQHSKLMPGDIFSNIVGSSPLTLEDAWEAARMVGLEEDIKAMPMGMHTIIAEGAGTISGGQKQRLMIARAIVKKPRILMFDEATSALDNRTQQIVTRSIEALNATRVVIAHRLSTIAKADRIFVIDMGNVVESGSYEELMTNNGTFALMAKRQLLE